MGPSPTPTYSKARDCKSATKNLSTSCTVVERPDHHCGDDLVANGAMLVTLTLLFLMFKPLGIENREATKIIIIITILIKL